MYICENNYKEKVDRQKNGCIEKRIGNKTALDR